MNCFVKKMCILKQMKNGYSADGAFVSGIVKAETYGNFFTCEVSLINFAPLNKGNYCCVVCDRAGETESIPLTETGGKIRRESKLNVSSGFLAVVCYVDTENYYIVACGVNGENVYEIGALLFKLFGLKKDLELSSVEEKGVEKSEIEEKEENYDDNLVAEENYYEYLPNFSGEVEVNSESNSALRIFKISNGDTYYKSIRSEIDSLFNSYPKDDSLREIFPHSVWVKIKNKNYYCLSGIIHENMVVKYICYAVPEEIADGESKKNGCFVPCSFVKGRSGGYIIIFRDADTGEYVKIKEG